MNKSTLTLAIFLAANAAHAQSAAPVIATTSPANYTLEGIVDGYLGSRELSGSTRLTRVDSGGLTTSQINLSGYKDLGKGLKAEFAVGAFFRPDDGALGRAATDVTFGRNSYVGLGGDFGTVRVGRQGTTDFLNFIRTNSFGDSPTFGPAFLHTWVSAIGQGTQFLSTGTPATNRTLTAPLGATDSAWNNAIKYISPNLNGTTLTVQYAPSEVDGVGDRSELGAFYAQGPLTLSLDTEQIGKASAPAVATAAAVINSQTTWHASGAYAFGFGRVSGGIINTQRTFAIIPNDQMTTTHIGATIPVGPGNVMWQTAVSTLSIQNGTDITRTTTSIGYDYVFTKDADLYTVVMFDKLSTANDGTSYGVGVRYRF